MSDTPARSRTRMIGILTAVVFLIVAVLIVARGCQEPDDIEDRINPDDPLPGANDTGSLFAPDAAPLLRAA